MVVTLQYVSVVTYFFQSIQPINANIHYHQVTEAPLCSDNQTYFFSIVSYTTQLLLLFLSLHRHFESYAVHTPIIAQFINLVNLQTPNINYSGRTAPLTSKVAFCIFIQQIQVLYILNMVYTIRFFSLQNAVCFIILTYLVPVLFTFYIQNVLKLRKNNSGAKRLKVLNLH